MNNNDTTPIECFEENQYAHGCKEIKTDGCSLGQVIMGSVNINRKTVKITCTRYTSQCAMSRADICKRGPADFPRAAAQSN